MVYCAVRFKPKKKRKVKGEVARKYRRSEAVSGVLSIPSLSYGHRVGCDTARSVLDLTPTELERRTDLEKETIEELREILRTEFEKE